MVIADAVNNLSNNGRKEMVYKCSEDGKSYYWKKGEIVGKAVVVNEVNQVKVIETKIILNKLFKENRNG